MTRQAAELRGVPGGRGAVYQLAGPAPGCGEGPGDGGSHVTTCSVKCRVTIILCQVARLLSGGCAYFAWSGAGAGDLSLNTARLAREEGGAEADYLANKVTRLY